ncbi:MAG: NADH-quinone oxidoreductase subunit A [Acidobacteria bacterium]|nr:MAG: NADH-quinone oxidoreductase subunit A [Acidobacteriota bacterium]
MVQYLALAFVAAFTAALVLAVLGIFAFLRPKRPNPTKLSPYECGVAAVTDAHDHRFSVRYYLLAVLFVVFDVETVFLFPWAVMYHHLALFGLIEMVIFLVILLVGYVYVWKRGALSWA